MKTSDHGAPVVSMTVSPGRMALSSRDGVILVVRNCKFESTTQKCVICLMCTSTLVNKGFLGNGSDYRLEI